jgi:hypothetical protein
MSTTTICVAKRKRSVSASSVPFSASSEWPAKTRSVVDSPGPERARRLLAHEFAPVVGLAQQIGRG